MTTERRFALMTFAVSSMLLVAASLATLVILQTLLTSRLDEQLDREQQRLTPAETGGGTNGVEQLCALVRRDAGQPSDFYTTVVDSTGEERCRSDLRQPALSANAIERATESRVGITTDATTVSVGDRRLRVAATDVRATADGPPTGTLLVAASTDDNDRVIEVLAGVLAAITVVGMVAAWLFGTFAGRRATRRLNDLERQVSDIVSHARVGARIDHVGAADLDEVADRFNLLLARVERLSSAQRKLMADAAHQLRTPLAGARTNIQVLERTGTDAPDAAEIVSDVARQLAALSVLVDQAVELASMDDRWGAGGWLEDVALDDVVATAVASARERHPGIDISCDVEPSRVAGDVEMLERAIANLVDNAAAWSPPGAHVGVTSSAEAQVVVCDEGPGFDEEELAHVFQPFYRGRQARRRPGSGLGLAFVDQVAQLHDGTATAANRADRSGAEVTLSLTPATYDADATDASKDLPRKR